MTWALVLGGGSARAADVPLSGTLQLGVSSGWDGNVFYSSETFGTVNDGFVELQPRGVLAVGVASGVTVGLDYAGAARIYLSAENEGTLGHALDVPVRWWVTDAVRLELTVGVDHYYSPLFATDHSAGAGGELAAAFSWGTGEVLLGYGAHVRAYIERDPAQHDLTHLPRVQLVQSVGSWLSLLAGYQLAPRISDQPGYDLLGHRALFGVAARVMEPVSIRDVYLLYVRTFDSTGATEVLHSNRLEVSWASLDWMDVFARYDLAINQADTAEREFVAHGASLGLEVRWGARTVGRDVHRALDLRDLPPPPDALRPIRVGDRVRFRVRAQGAAKVAVVGAFNDWQPDAAPMALDPATGVWSADLVVPPGSWEFAYLLNGERVTVPEEADFYTESGFGDRNAVVVVESQ